MKKILVTGASGFIGSFLADRALSNGWDTWAGIRKNSSREYLTDPRIQFIDLHYSDPEKLKSQLQEHARAYGKWDYIIHNAGITKCLDPEDFDRVNYMYTRHFIEALRETGTAPEKFILMSSLSAYPNPDTAYGKSKLKAERFLQDQHDFPYIILRPTGVYGPREKDYFLMVKSVRAGFDLTAGFEPQLLTFIYVKDLVEAAFLALGSPLSGKAYAVADGRVYTDQEYTGIVARALGKKRVMKIRIPFLVLKAVSVLAEAFSKFSGKPSTLNRDKYFIMKRRDWRCDTKPIEEDLGFRAAYHLEEGMRECIDWYISHGWLYQ